MVRIKAICDCQNWNEKNQDCGLDDIDIDDGICSNKAPKVKSEAVKKTSLFKGTYYKIIRITRPKSHVHYLVRESTENTETQILKLATRSKVRLFLYILILKLRGFRHAKYGEMTQDTYISYYRKPKSEIL